ncbi:S8 family serine peptidase [Rathayibacter sp. VKM Ac-2928]|uniref:S8 family serine peptidase n=1 Tax=Rathayibacter sp. VKM Ac-2928 TaxID=2929479 RepID=UPI001FB1C9F5|nr:S8 family serine peptidase [Rathayibacter sp. VKM Ac-2928]MCJ1685417.1 S8 family peptidase [Rathayibacter sp. VKM Ac-2928]
MSTNRGVLAALATLALAAGALAPVATAATVQTQRYIVQTSTAGAARVAVADAGVASSAVSARYTRVLTGFAAELTAAQVAELDGDPTVVSITPDAPTEASTVQTDPPYGLDRIDQRETSGDALYNYDTTGAGVTVFLVDSGMRFSHTEFSGRATSGWDFVDGDADASDCAGHGTHVAGTIGGETYGVAKDVAFVSLRVWGCNNRGWMSDMVAAMDWAVANKPAGPSVLNMSGSGGADAAMNAAVENTVAAGIAVVVAGSNNNSDACAYSPAGAASALTVGAVDPVDQRASFSNYGSCIDLFAPGVNTISSTIDSDYSSGAMSGTSMATPHVAGIVARYQEANPTATVAQITSAVLGAATPDVVIDPVGSPNLLAYAAPPVPVVDKPLSGQTPTISGAAQVGKPLTATAGTWSPQPVALSYQWKRDGSVLQGATGASYTPVAADAGTTLTVTVTGTKTGYTTLSKSSAGVVVTPGLQTLMPTPTISGGTTVGSTLTANPGTWDSGVTLSYQWKKNGGTYISGATAKTYVLRASDAGATLTVSVTSTKPGFSPATKTSATTAAVTNGTVLTGPTPTITGTPTVGQKLTAVPGTWAPAPVALAYQWKRGGVAISGATASSYTLVAADADTAITVSVTGTKTGYAALTKTSAATTVKAALQTAMPVPTITGTKTVGATLTANPGTWDAGTTLTYQWKKNGGTYISGATAKTYVLKASDAGATLTVSVTSTKPGFSPATKTSATTSAIAKGTLTGATPTITGTAKVGQILTAKPGTWAPAPVTLTYQWYRGTTAISGATSATYKLATADKAGSITVKVTGTKTGYTTLTKTSTAVKPS